MEFYADAAGRIDLAVRNVRVLARGAIRAVQLDENVPPDVAEALGELAAAVRALAAALGTDLDFAAAREHAGRAAAIATLVLEATTNLSVSVIVGQIRSTATDLMTGTGLSYDEATVAVRDAIREPG
jgi:redox-regulated HSP33 family molecular chaperone